MTVPPAPARPPRRAGWRVPFWWRGYGLAVTDTVFAARHGLLRRNLSLVPHAKVQSIRLTQGPWKRLHGLADVHVDTGADETVTARLRGAQEATELLRAQADRSRTGRREARPDRWMAAAAEGDAVGDAEGAVKDDAGGAVEGADGLDGVTDEV